MTSGTYLRAGLRLLVAAGVLATARAAAGPLVAGIADPRTAPAPDGAAPRGPYAADSVSRVVVARDLFRLGRRPAQVAYDPARASRPAEGPIAPPKPALRLTGLVEGAHPQALIEGLPGVEGGRALGRGDVAGGLRVAEIGRGQVRVVGMDTVWVLTLRRP